MIPNLKGVVYLMGGVEDSGRTDRDVDVGLTDMRDKKTIDDAIKGTRLAGRFHFVKMKPGGKPDGKFSVLAKGTIPHGGLKKVPVELFKSVPSHKPEKKALTVNEVFTTKALLNLLPEGMLWDVSWKYDGLRMHLHKDRGKIIGLSDEEKVIPEKKIMPIIKEAVKLFPEQSIIDGELQIYLNGSNQHHQGISSYIHKDATPTDEEYKGIRFSFWDILLTGNEPLTERPFEERISKLPKGGTKHIVRARHVSNVPKNKVLEVLKKVQSPEGAIVRAMDAAYWATHSTYKMKRTYDVDVKVNEVKPTKAGAIRYVCSDREGNILGTTYGQTHTKAKVGDIIRVMVTEVNRHWDKENKKWIYHWFTPTVAKPDQPTTGKGVRIGGPVRTAPDKKADPQKLFEEIYVATRGKYRPALKEPEKKKEEKKK